MGKKANIVEWLTLFVVILSPIFSYFLIDIYSVNKTKAEYTLIEKQVKTFNEEAEKMLTELRLIGTETKLSADVMNIVNLLYPQFTLKHVDECLLNEETVRVRFVLKNAGNLPLTIEQPIVEIDVKEAKKQSTSNSAKSVRWNYIGPYKDYPAREGEFVFFDFSFPGEGIPKNFKSKIIFQYKTVRAALVVTKKILEKHKIIGELENLTKGSFSMDYQYIESPRISRCN